MAFLQSIKKLLLSNLGDTDISSATQGEVLAVDSNGKWANTSGILRSNVLKFSESKTSSYGVVTTNIPVTKCLLGYYFGAYGLIPYKHSSGNWYFNVVNAENGYIVPKVGETETLTVYYYSFDMT